MQEQPYKVPASILRNMLTIFTRETRDLILNRRADDPDSILAVPDPFPKVMAWLWTVEPDVVILNLSSLTHELRMHNPHPGKPITLNELLVNVRTAFAAFMPAEQLASLLDRARAEIPGNVGADVNS